MKSLIGPDPRIVADDVWAKLVWAGLNLEESDLRLTGSQHHFYPLALVRAMTITWLFAGLRCNEIRRLRRELHPVEGQRRPTRWPPNLSDSRTREQNRDGVCEAG